MSRIVRHPVNEEGVRKRVVGLGGLLPKAVSAARRDLVHCSALTTDALEYAAQVLVLDPESPEACPALRIGAQATVALFEGAVATAEKVEIRLGDGPPALVPSAVDPSVHHVGNWTHGFYMSAICREKELLDSLCRVPIELLRRSTTRGLEHMYLTVEALQAYWRRGAEARERALAALKATQDGPQPTAVARELSGPAIEVLVSLIDGQAEPFQAALVRALERHRDYWSRQEVMRDPRGYISLGLTGLAALAHEAGIAVRAESDYLPMGLVRGDFRPAA